MMLAMASARSSLRSRLPTCRRGISVFGGPTKTALSSVLQVSEEVQEAIHGRIKKPVVALESAIYTHGFPYPDNIALSSHLESIVRMGGGVPATVGIVDGIARIGMDPDELIRLSRSAGSKETLKISRRDLAYACGDLFRDRTAEMSKKFMGGTTIAGTMVLAHLAGIKVFATGGLGGVHRDGENTLDISADLTELGRTPVTVISSGCKSFLDIGRTLEYLETQGVGVATFADGRTGPVKFPGFWSRDSDSQSPQIVQDAKHAAAMIHAQHSMGLTSGLLLANPIPEDHEIPLSEISSIISNAVAEANELGISGAKNTPFILSKIKELTEGKSVTANRALISSNVALATSVAKELLRLESNASDSIDSGQSTRLSNGRTTLKDMTLENTSLPRELWRIEQPPSGTDPNTTSNTKVDIVVAGAVAIDVACNYMPPKPKESSKPVRVKPILHSSNEAGIKQSIGGVAHNVALASTYAGKSVRLMSAVGNDFMGRLALEKLREEGLDTEDVLQVNRHGTATYVSINDSNKDLMVGMADMAITQTLPNSCFNKLERRLRNSAPNWFVIDGNWFLRKMGDLLLAAKSYHLTTAEPSPTLTAFEPTSDAKCIRLLSAIKKNQDGHTRLFPQHIVDLATPNDSELTRMWNKAQELGLLELEEHWAIVNSFNLPQGSGNARLVSATSEALVNEGVPQRAIQLLPYIPTLTVTLGARGVLLAQILRADDERLSDPAAAPYIVGRSGATATKEDSASDREQVGGVYLRLFGPANVLDDKTMRSVNGAGDTFTGVLIAALADGRPIEEAVMLGQRAAVRTLSSDEAVSPFVRSILNRPPDGNLKALFKTGPRIVRN